MTLLQLVEAIPGCAVAALWIGTAAVILWDRKTGGPYERAAREIRAHSESLQEQERARTRTHV
uniref:Uncharacterized protein n=1 Tax=Pseudomonas phage HRDY3 TaxID=3236930 RepID=A0AB39CEN2_9VIRU